MTLIKGKRIPPSSDESEKLGGGNRKINLHTESTKFSEISPNIAFPEFNFYELYHSTFEKRELGRIKKLLSLREMAEDFGLIRKSMRPKLGRKSFFAPEGEVALMSLKMYTGLSCPILMELARVMATT